MPSAILPASFRLGQIFLLPKEGGCLGDPGARSPITLMNAEYKLLTSFLSLWSQTVLPKLTKLRLTCPVPISTIYSLVALTRDLVKYTRAGQASALLVSLEKAKDFDRVEHKYMFRLLGGSGLLPEKSSMIECLYNGMQSE